MEKEAKFGDAGKMNNWEAEQRSEEITGGVLEQELKINRFFSHDGKDVFKFDLYGNPINWISEDVSVTDEKGNADSTQKNVRRPIFGGALVFKVWPGKSFWEAKKKARGKILLNSLLRG